LYTLATQAGGELRYDTALIGFKQDEEGITATIRDRSSGTSRRVRTRFLIAADGSRSWVRKQLGIGQHGEGSLGHFISMVFEAPGLMDLFHKRQAVMCFLSNEKVSGALVAYPGSGARPHLFRLDTGYDPKKESLTDYPEARCLPLIRAAIGIPDFPVQLKTVLTWEMVARISDCFQQGRVFLVGDAARAQPPAGALGGNTGIAEAQNLAWKLAAVLRGEAGERLLDTYDAERRPLADYTVEQVALLSQQRKNEGSEGITVDTLAINMGYRYRVGAIVPEDDKNLPYARRPDLWMGQPGTRAAHIVLEREGKSLSTLDLFGSHFVLLVGPDGQNWIDVARRTSDVLHFPLDVYRIGGDVGDFIDAGNAFCDAYGITSTGAVIVRPDGFVGWRSQGSGENAQEPEQTLTEVLTTLLCSKAATDS
jgi:putative polyketide hydroxylase